MKTWKHRESLSVKREAVVSFERSKISEVESEQPPDLQHRENARINKADVLSLEGLKYMPCAFLENLVYVDDLNKRMSEDILTNINRASFIPALR